MRRDVLENMAPRPPPEDREICQSRDFAPRGPHFCFGRYFLYFSFFLTLFFLSTLIFKCSLPADLQSGGDGLSSRVGDIKASVICLALLQENVEVTSLDCLQKNISPPPHLSRSPTFPFILVSNYLLAR